MLLDVFVRQKLEKFVELEFKNSSSDEDIKIKVEKFATNEIEIDSSKPTKPTKKIDKIKYTKKTASKTLSKRAKEKAPVRTSSSSSSSDSSSNSDSPSSSDNSSSSDSSSSSDNSNVPFYFKKENMPSLTNLSGLEKKKKWN